MDAPPVQFTRTSDGRGIAYAVSGAGDTVVWLPQLFGNFREYWSRSFIRPWIEALVQRYTLVMYDARNQGSSTRAVPVSAFSDFDRDLEAIVQTLTLDRFVLMATDWYCHVAVRYAARNPERVRALILSTASISNTAWPRALFETLAADDFDAFLRSQAAVGQSTDLPASMRSLKQTISQEDWVALTRAAYASDISYELSIVQAPTLVIHARDFFNVPPEESMRFAAAMPNAKFVLLDGAQGMGNADQGILAIERFLSGLVRRPSESAPTERNAPTPLTPRQLEVLRLLAMGKSTRDIARQMVISERTVERHVADIYDRLGVANRAQAAVYAKEHGIV